MASRRDEDNMKRVSNAGYDAGFEESWGILKKFIKRLKEVYGPAEYKFEPMAIIEVLEKAEHHPDSGLDEKREQVKAGVFVTNLEEAFLGGFDAGVIAGWDAGKQVIEALGAPRWLDTFLEVLDVAWGNGARRFFPFDADLVKVGNVSPSSLTTQ